MLHKDDFLSSYFPLGAYRYDPPYDASELLGDFCYAKLPTNDTENLIKLVNQGFGVIDVLLHFEQQKAIDSTESEYFHVGMALPQDKEDVLKIAAGAFTFSRFSRDKNIIPERSSAIKIGWVENFFNGSRGDGMIVARVQNKVVGFLLLINKNIIDLIAVAPNNFRRGVASQLIAFANQKRGLLAAGTQIINRPSITMYQKLNFYMTRSWFVLHRHMAL